MTSLNTHSDPIILEMRSITKEFPGVKALADVNLRVKAGEIHAICGENGAGKSTLMKVLSGVYPFGTLHRGHRLPERSPGIQGHPGQRARRNRDHPPGTRAHPGTVHHGEHLPRQRAHQARSDRLGRGPDPLHRTAGPGRPARRPGHPDQGNRRRQAAARRNRQGPEQVGEAPDPGRAHGRAQRIRLPAPAGPDARPEGPRHHLHHHFPQAQRDRADRGLHHDHPRRQVDRNPRRQGRRRRRGPHHQGHGGPDP